MGISRRTIVLSAAASLAMPYVARAQEFPSKPIRILVAFGAGSGLDVTARIFAQFLSEEMKTGVVVENQPGANGIIGTVAARNAPADGYTLMFVSPPFATAYLMVPEKTYDPIQDFVPIIRVTTNPIMIVAAPSQPFKSFKELIQHARDNPGRVQYATSGKGSSSHLETALICQRYGLQAIDIPYKAFGPAITDTIAGRVGFFLSALPALLPHVQGGGVRALAVGSGKRVASLPDVPTLAEEYNEPGYEGGVWYGLVAPAGTPAPVARILSDKVMAVLEKPALREKVIAAGNEISVMPGDRFTGFVREERDKWEKVIDSLNLKQLKT